MRKQAQNTHPEQGNVLFYILIAIALIAALSYAVSSSTRGGMGGISTEQAKLRASEIIAYGNTMANAVSQLRLRGVDEDELCFDDPSWGVSDYDHSGCTDSYNKIFSPDGGGLTWVNAPADAMDSGGTPDNLWHIYGDNEVDEVGTTCGDSSCSDLLLIVDELSEAVCLKINDQLGITNPSNAPPTDTSYGTTRYIGVFGYTATIGDEVGGENIQGKQAACFRKTAATAKYTFYKVLLAR